MKNNYELFAVTKEIVTALEAIGEYNFSKRIEDALSISTLPGEILGEIRVRLKEVPQNILIDSHMEKKTNLALKYLDNILR